ncbi:AAA family ATPase [Pannonibacter phragmitetus]|nr:AAA family ATPase [Pannonibacter phragmitetus]
MSQSIITQIEVDRLFNRFSYKLPSGAEFSKSAILYGDNGVGKSTILRLVFHLLSSAGDRGHRSALRSVAFKLLAVKLSNGMLFKAERQEISERNDYNDGPLTLTIENNGKLLAEWNYIPGRKDEISYYYTAVEDGFFIDDEFEQVKSYIQEKGINFDELSRNTIKKIKSELRHSRSSKDDVKRGERPYLGLLAQLAPTMFYVNAERRLDSDAVADPSDELELRRAITHHEPKRINDLVNRAREIALSQALVSASRWVQRRAVQSANQGSTNVHSVYVNVLHHLSNDYHQRSSPKSRSDFEQLIRRLEDIEVQTNRLEEYELAATLDMGAFKESLSSISNEQRELSSELIKPYIESVWSRLDALSQIYKILDRFVKNINSFLTGKRIIYKLTQGFSIVTSTGRLDPSQLSSGEQQLILMFCYALTARDRPSVFMIDEPEISLNVKWQRQLLQSLTEITSGSDIQFILASHSLELISQHRDKVVKLENSY